MKVVNIPRMPWVNKQWTLAEVHFHIFEFFITFFRKWYESHEDPNASIVKPPY